MNSDSEKLKKYEYKRKNVKRSITHSDNRSSNSSNGTEKRFQKKRITKTADKVALQVLIPRDLYEKLVVIAPQLYGSTKGALSAIVEEALRLYLEPRVNTNIKVNPTYKVRAVYEAVVQKIKELMHISFKPKEVPEHTLDKAIGDVRGSDPRTIQKWKDTFLKYGLIKVAGGYPPNRIFELL